MTNKKYFELYDISEIVKNIKIFIQNELKNFHKQGIVIGISGGIDSALSTSLAVKALGKEKVLGLILPEKESDPQNTILAEKFANSLKIQYEIIDITSMLDSLKIYEERESIIKKYYPSFNKNSKYRLSITSNISSNKASIPFIEILENDNISNYKISFNDYSSITAATTMKIRTRMMLLNNYAEKNNFLVLGTTNKSEYDVGNFVRYGDGGVDIEPFLHLYKTQIFQLAKYLNIFPEIIEKKPSPDTWSFDTSDEEFFYGMSYEKFDLLLYSINNNISTEIMSQNLNLSTEQTELLLKNIKRKITSSEFKRKMPTSLID